METIVGFVAGCLVGTSAGEAGLKRLQESWQASSTSPHVCKMAADALAVAAPAARQVSRRLGALGGGLMDGHRLAEAANPALSPGSRAG